MMLKYILFDLDETLYPATCGLMTAIGDRMRGYLQEKFQLSPEDAHTLQKRFWNQYGTTLRGLMLEHEIDPQDYLRYVHAVDISQHISPDPQLADVLQKIPYPKAIVTNADVPHAERVLQRLGIRDQFTSIFDIVFMEYECKPARGAYERVLRALDAQGDECILVEDTPRNLPTARELGIHTILLTPENVVPPEPSWLLDPAKQKAIDGCPPSAELCIPDIYHVADAIHQIAPALDKHPA
ncbi:MAG TPA: pyrimidine 5'-nucleotidase [Anaerolineae bacterium]|nr:pyrimidine 5'-nucleotidase [Anaerolineae bacterium]